MIILTMFSPPDTNGIITQAMAIQAHQPDVVIFFDVKLNNSNIEIDGKKRLEAWIKGSENLISSFPNLEQPYPFQITPPKGYIPRNGTLPKLITKSCKKEDIKDIFKELTNEYSNIDELRFDFLPGAKLLKIPLLISEEIKSWRVCYTLQTGKIIYYDDEKQLQFKGKPLKIIDRCWLAGFPSHIENHLPFKKGKQEFIEEIFNNLSIEKFDEESPFNQIATQKTQFERQTNRPIGINSDETIRKLENSNFQIDKNHNKIKITKGVNKWEIDLFQDGIPNGVPLEILMANHLSIWWNNYTEILQGVSLIPPTPKMREAQLKKIMNHQLHDYKNAKDMSKQNEIIKLKIEKFEARCDKYGLDYLCSLDELVEAYITEQRNNSFGNSHTELHYIRICEIDCLLLDDFGITSFDAKGTIGKGSRAENPTQAARQKPSFLHPNSYYVVSCTDPPDNISKLLHLSQLKGGRKVLENPLKHSWNPTDRNEYEIWKEQRKLIIQKQNELKNRKLIEQIRLAYPKYETLTNDEICIEISQLTPKQIKKVKKKAKKKREEAKKKEREEAKKKKDELIKSALQEDKILRKDKNKKIRKHNSYEKRKKEREKGTRK